MNTYQLVPVDFSTTMVIYLTVYVTLRKVAEQSGFRSQPTFRKAFQEVMGCLPSEVKTNSPSPALSQGSEYRMKQLHEDLRYSSASCTK